MHSLRQTQICNKFWVNQTKTQDIYLFVFSYLQHTGYYPALNALDKGPLLAPRGALIVIVCY